MKPIQDQLKKVLELGCSAVFVLEPPCRSFSRFFFDFDGTLVDSLWIMKLALGRALHTLAERADRPTAAQVNAFLEEKVFAGFAGRRVIAVIAAMLAFLLRARRLDTQALLAEVRLLSPFRPSPAETAAVAAELGRLHALPGTEERRDMLSLGNLVYTVYSGLYLPSVREVVEGTIAWEEHVLPGVFDFLSGLKGRECAIISGGSLPRVARVARSCGLVAVFGDNIFAPAGVERLVKGGRFKLEKARELAARAPRGECVFFDDRPGVLKSLKQDGLYTVAILHDPGDIPAILDAAPGTLITHDLRCLSGSTLFPG